MPLSIGWVPPQSPGMPPTVCLGRRVLLHWLPPGSAGAPGTCLRSAASLNLAAPRIGSGDGSFLLLLLCILACVTYPHDCHQVTSQSKLLVSAFRWIGSRDHFTDSASVAFVVEFPIDPPRSSLPSLRRLVTPVYTPHLPIPLSSV